MKDIYKTQHLRDEAGHRPVRECRNHKNRNWWSTIKDRPAHLRVSNGQMRTLEGRKVHGHEDLIIDILGNDWEEHIDSYSDIDMWMKDIHPLVARYLVAHKLPPDPRYQNLLDKQGKWRNAKEKERRDKEKKGKGEGKGRREGG